VIYGGVAAAVIAVIIVLAVVLSSTGNPAPSTPSGAITYGQAAPGSNYSVRSFQGTTGWSLLFVAGLAAPTGEPAAIALSDLGDSNCTVTPTSGHSGNITMPAFTGTPTSGHAPLWEFFYQNSSTDTVAIVVVEDGSATVLGTIASPECTAIFNILNPIPAKVLDSPAIGSAVAANASAFLTAHPGASAVYGLIGPLFELFPVGANGAKWVVEFSTCPITPDPTGVGAEYNASVNASSGAVFYAQTVPSESCVSDPPAEVGIAPLQSLVSAAERSGTSLRAR
jgi:hypothetical protein